MEQRLLPSDTHIVGGVICYGAGGMALTLGADMRRTAMPLGPTVPPKPIFTADEVIE